MPSRISQDIRNLIVTKWIAGNARDEIAQSCKVSTGTVSNVVDEWSTQLGLPTADSIRELSVELRRSSISAPECAQGFRILNILRQMGVSEDKFHSFISEMYDQCRYYKLSPVDLVQTSFQILEQLPSISLSDFPHYVEEKNQEKNELERKIALLVDREQTIKNYLTELLNELRTTQIHFEEFTRARNELRNYGIDIHEIHMLATAIRNAKDYQFDSLKIATQLTMIDSLAKRESELRESLAKLQDITASTKVYDKELVEEFNQRRLHKEALEREIQILERQKTDLEEWLDVYFKTTKESLENIIKKFRGNILGLNYSLRSIISNLHLPGSVAENSADVLSDNASIEILTKKLIDPNSSISDDSFDFDIALKIVGSRFFSPVDLANGIPLKIYLDEINRREG